MALSLAFRVSVRSSPANALSNPRGCALLEFTPRRAWRMESAENNTLKRELQRV